MGTVRLSEHPKLVDFRSPHGLEVTKVRSTLLMSSLQALREAGSYERYVEILPTQYHEKILFSSAPEWLPVEVAQAHYRACDGLQLDEDALAQIGMHVSNRIMGTFLGTLLRSSRNLGTSPWIALKQYDRLWQRIFVGGACSVEQAGPKDAVIRSYGIPMLETQYFRTAYVGVIHGAGVVFAKSSFERELKPPDGIHSSAIQMSWV